VQLTGGRRWPRRVLLGAGVIAATAGATGLLAAAGTLRPLPAPPAAGAASLLLCGVALATLDLHRPARREPAAGVADLAAPAAILIAPAGLRGHLGTLAVTALLLGAAVVAARPDRGLPGLLRRPGPAGTAARYLAPPVAAVALGGVRYPALTALALLLGAAVLAAAAALERQDRRLRGQVAALRDERDFGAALLRSMPGAVLVQEPAGQIVEANPRCCALVGRAREELIGVRPPYPWQAGTGAPDEPPVGRAAEHLLRRADGALVAVLAGVAPVPDSSGRPRAYVTSYTDISDRVRAEEDLAARAAQLLNTNDDLRRVNRELARAAGFKSDLIDMVSHELSQPLSSLVSLAELLVTDWEVLPGEIRLDLATKIDSNTGRLARMVNDLMLLFRLDAGLVTARRAPVPVQPLVEAVLHRLTAPVEVAAFVEPELAVLADREHLAQVMSNLVTNAVEFGGRPIEVSARHRPDGVVLAVRDHGGGIPPELAAQLFQRFTRAGTVGASGRKGTGLGLYIAAHLARLNGGEIWYEPVAPHGACLLLRLVPAP
jgi:PAS domain S-box-containing protein